MPVDIALKPSRYLSLFVWLVAGLVLLALIRLPLTLPLIILLALVLALLAYRDWQQPARTSTRLSYHGEQWMLEINGEQLALELRHATVWQRLVSLSFRESGAATLHRLVLLPDSCAADDLRRLRALLRNSPVLA